MASTPNSLDFQAQVFTGFGLPSGDNPKGVTVNLDFNIDTNWLIDFQQVQSLGKLTQVQAIYFDNRLSPDAVIVSLNSSFQEISLPAYSQGYLPIFAVQPAKAHISGQAGSRVQIVFLNFPVAPAVWGAQGGMTYNANGELLVDMPALSAIISAGHLNAMSSGLASVDNPKPIRIANEIYYASLAGATTSAVIIPAGGAGMGWYFTECELRLSGNATLAAAGPLSISLMAGSTVIAETEAWLPDVAPNEPGPNYIVMAFRNTQYNAKADNVALSVSIGAALSTGSLTANVAGGITTDIV